MGDWWSVAWRLHDAQFWGVPQRRKRIALVADFGGKSAPEILFERERMPGNIEQSKQEREEASRDIRESAHQSAYTLKIRGGAEIDSYGKRAGKGALVQTEKSGTLVATDYKDPQLVCYALDRASFNQGKNAQYDFSVQEDIAQPLVARGPGGVLTQLGHYVQETTKE